MTDTPRARLTAYPENIEQVVASGLCTGCGLCASLAGPAVTMDLNIEGNMRPLAREVIPEQINAVIMTACPGASVDGPGQPTGVDTHPVWGPMRGIHRSWSGNAEVRHKAAAGGTLTALGQYLLTSGRVQAVLHVRADPDRPWRTLATVSRTSEEVLAAAQSRYGPSAPLVHVQQLLDEGTVFALIAKPCDISAVRALGRTDPRVASLVPYMLTIFCGGIHVGHMAGAIMRHHGVDPRDVEVFRYRGEGWPGPLRVQTRDGTRYDLPYPGGWHGKKYAYELQFRCKICPDAVGEMADISAPDGWVLKDGKPVHDEGPGVNVAVVRTPVGEELLNAAVAAGVLEISPITVDEIEQMHVNHPDRKSGAAAAVLALRLMRQKSMRVSGYRTAQSLRRAGLSGAWRQFIGTVRRVRAGENREHLI